MKWIGQHIWSFISRFRDDVYLEDLADPGADTDKFLVVDANDKVGYRTGAEVLNDIGATSSTGDITGVDLTGGTGIEIASETNTTSGDYSATINCDLEGTELKSTDETGTTKFLRVDGDGSCSWQVPSYTTNTDTKIWQCTIPGYIASINDTDYYTRGTTSFLNWDSSDTDPTTVNHALAATPFFIANVGDGNITEINIQGTATGTDPIVFYFYKANPATGIAAVSLTEMFNTGSITPPSANRAYAYADTIGSSNTFTQDQRLYVYAKKASTSGLSSNYYTISISGEYT